MPFTNPATSVSLAPGATVTIGGGQLTNPGGTPVQPISDQLTSGDLGTGADGAVTLTSNTTLVRDMNYSSLTINAGVTLSTAGYLIRCTGTVTNNGTGDNSGGNAAGSGGGTGAPSGTLIGGANGASAGSTSKVNGNNAPTADVQGGTGGNVGTLATGGTVNPSGALGLSMSGLRSLSYAGGASGAAYNSAGSGGAGGVIIIICDTTAGSGTWRSNAGNSSASGGSAGGSGGGIVYVACRTRSDTWTLLASGAPGVGALAGFPGRTGILVCNGS